MERGILMTTYGLGVSRGKTSLFGLRQAVRCVSESERAGVLLRSGLSKGAQAQMAQQETG